MRHQSALEKLRQLRADVAALGGGDTRTIHDAMMSAVEPATAPRCTSPWAEPVEVQAVDAPDDSQQQQLPTPVETAASLAETASAETAASDGLWHDIRNAAPGWFVSAATHALLLLVLGFTALSTQQVVPWKGLELAAEPSADAAPESLDNAVGDLGPAATELPDAGGGEGTIAGDLAQLEPISTVPVSVDLGGLAIFGDSSSDELTAMIGDGRELALGSKGDFGGGIGEGAGAGKGDGAGGGNAGKRGGNGYAIFFGREAKGSRFVYVVDSSESMTGLRFQRATAELMSSIVGLDSKQSFYVIFFNHAEFPQFYPEIDNFLSTANGQSVDKLGFWMRNVRPMGSTNPAPALKRALELEPDAVFLLSDGEFDLGPVMRVIQTSRKSHTIVHTIAFGSDIGRLMLEKIAEVTGGQYRFVPLF